MRQSLNIVYHLVSLNSGSGRDGERHQSIWVSYAVLWHAEWSGQTQAGAILLTSDLG